MNVFYKGTDIPCWFELSFEGGSVPSILIKVRQDLVDMDFGSLALSAEERGNELGINQIPLLRPRSFLLPPEKNVGFAPFLTEEGRGNAFVTYRLTAPRVLVTCGGLVCDSCGGFGEVERLYSIETCDDCRGSKLKRAYSWDDAYALSLTLSVLSSAWFHPSPRSVVETGYVQLLSFMAVTDRRMHGGSLSGSFSPAFAQWLVTDPNLSSVERAMQETYTYCLGEPGGDFMRQCQVRNYDGWLTLDCPGDACGIHPSEQYSGREVRRGFDFACHNVDSPVQQLTLLAGLAALHDEARRAGV